MDKTFYFHSGYFFDTTNLFQTQFSGRYHSAGTLLMQKFCTVFSRDRHLGTSMQFHLRKGIADKSKYAHILNNDTVQTGAIIRQQIFIKLRELRFFYQGIYGKIYFSAKQVRIADTVHQFFFRKILSICSCAKSISSQIDRICSRVYGSVKSLNIPGRSK